MSFEKHTNSITVFTKVIFRFEESLSGYLGRGIDFDGSPVVLQPVGLMQLVC